VTETRAPAKTSGARRPHRILIPILIALGALCILVSTISIWVRDTVLDTENWVEQSGQLLESPAVRDVMAVYIVDQAYSAADVQTRIETALPEQFKPLAGPAAAQLQGVADEAAAEALARPRVQDLWRAANEAVHLQLVALLEGETERVQLEGDAIVLNLDAIVANVAGRIGVGEDAVATVQDRVEPVVIMQADELETVQTAVNAIKVLSFWPFILGVGLWAGAVYLARGRRRETLRAIALTLLLLGIVLLAVRRIGGNAIVDSLVQAESVKPAAEDVWAIFTSLLAESAVAGVAVGAIGLAAVWLAGPNRRATAVRHWLAPTFRDRAPLVHGLLAAVILLLLIWGPLGTPRRLLSLVIVTVLAFAGLEVLRRQTVREFPDAVPGEAMSLRAAFALPRGASGEGEQAEDSKMDRLERLAALRERGALTDEEYEAEKALLLT
jgi:Short C-terminal domain